MGRLENIIARNQKPIGLRATVGLAWRGVLLLLLLIALLFTDWALSRDDAPAPQPAARPRPVERRLDGVPVLRAPRAGGAAPRAGSAGESPAAAAAPAQ